MPVRVQSASSESVRSQPLLELLGPSSVQQQRELHWRLAPVVAGALLALLVLPAAVGSPRSGRFGVIVPALVGYLVYTNAINLVLGRDDLDPAGVWAVHLLVALAALIALLSFRRRW